MLIFMTFVYTRLIRAFVNIAPMYMYIQQDNLQCIKAINLSEYY